MEYIALKLSATTLNTIGVALNEIAYKYAAPALKEINDQVQAYVAEKQNAGLTGKSGSPGGQNGEYFRAPDADAPRYGKDQPEG